jgi:Ser/Thr protein kinase RdoA (MazF antagonist)
MLGSLGEKIGEGAFSDVHAWAPGQVIKLFKTGVPRRIALHEARMTRVVFAAGVPAPEVFDEVTLEGRFGIVLQRLDGPNLRQLSRSGTMSPLQVGAILAALAISVHKTPAPPEVFSLYDWMDGSLRVSVGIPKHIAAGILTLIERLPPGDRLCHCDLHSGNVIMTADGPRLIDWFGIVRAPAALDLGLCQLLSELLWEIVDDPERPRAVNAAMQSEYARLTDMSPAALTAAIDPYLPIGCAFALLGGTFPVQRERLIQRVADAMISED